MDRCLFFIFQLLLLVSCSKSDVSLIDLVKEDYTSYLYGPVQINGHVVNLMIDTGANTTVIDAAKAKEMNLSPSDTCSAHVSLVKGEWAGTCYSRETEIKIGDIEMSCNLFFANYNESLPVDLGPWPFDGILGMDVMTRLNWFVDLKNSQLWLSTGRMDYPIKQTPDFTLEMRRGEMAYTSVVLCDSVEHKVLFDTGYFKKVILNGYELTPTLVLLDSILNQCKSDTAGTCYMSFEDMEWLIYDSLKIGNLSLPYVLLDNSKRERSERYVGLLTCNFLSYFDYMAYDREKERIYLYNYNDDIAETQEMKDFYHKIRKAYRGEIELKELLKKGVMKPTTFTLILAVCAWLVGCKNTTSSLTEEEQKLVGKYCTVLSKEMEKSDTLPAMTIMVEGYTTYNADRTDLDEGTITLAVKAVEVLKQPVVTLEYSIESKGTWQIEDGCIKGTTDLEQFEWNFKKSNAETEEAKTFVKLVKTGTSVLAFEMKKFLFQFLQSDGGTKIIELTDEKLVVEQDGEQFTMARVK